MSERMGEAIEKIISFAKLKHGWDGHRGVPTTGPAIVTALRLLPMFDDPDGVAIVPTGGGGVFFEQNEFGLEINADGRIVTDD